MSASFSGCVPCEKLSRATSRPARTRPRKVVSLFEAGPRVPTILARRGAASGARFYPTREAFIHPPTAISYRFVSRKQFHSTPPTFFSGEEAELSAQRYRPFV